MLAKYYWQPDFIWYSARTPSLSPPPQPFHLKTEGAESIQQRQEEDEEFTCLENV